MSTTSVQAACSKSLFEFKGIICFYSKSYLKRYAQSKVKTLEDYEIIIRHNSISYKVQSDQDLCFALDSGQYETTIEVELHKKPTKHSSICLAVPYNRRDVSLVKHPLFSTKPIRLPRLSTLFRSMPKQGTFTCTYGTDKKPCGQVFRRSYDLSRHQMIHLKDRPFFDCTECNKKFTRLDALKRHARGHQK